MDSWRLLEIAVLSLIIDTQLDTGRAIILHFPIDV